MTVLTGPGRRGEFYAVGFTVPIRDYLVRWTGLAPGRVLAGTAEWALRRGRSGTAGTGS